MKNSFVRSALAARELPALPERSVIVETLLREEYGRIPDTEVRWTVGPVHVRERRMCCGTVSLSNVDMTLESVFGSHTFPICRLLHNDGQKHPFFIFLGFHADLPSLYYPMEEIAERGFDVISACYKEISTDDGDFTNGLSGVLFGPEGRKKPDDCGKLGVWAFAASRMLDYALTLPSVDPDRAAVIGHSRLGKTALLAGMLDERFRFVCPNDSGCCGDALNRGNTGIAAVPGQYGRYGETLHAIITRFPFWFCENFLKYENSDFAPDFDQHWLLASIAPRFLACGSADMDEWADPTSQFLSACAASEAWERLGLPGFVPPDRLPEPGEQFCEGSVSFHLRHGMHFQSRFDWNRYMDFIEAKKEN